MSECMGSLYVGEIVFVCVYVIHVQIKIPCSFFVFQHLDQKLLLPLQLLFFNLTCTLCVQPSRVSGAVAYCVHCAWLENALAGQIRQIY